MKIAAVSMVKDECDIIELFVRINCRAVDKLFVLDNGSGDTTRAVLDRLAEEGMPIEILSDVAIDYPQDKITTRLIRMVAESAEFDWILPLDADEFIQADRERISDALHDVPRYCCGLLPWATFVPIAEARDCLNPLWFRFRQRSTEPRQFSKVAVPAALASSGSVTMGNHGFKDRRGRIVASHPLAVALAHVPVRSSAQIVSKAIVGTHKFSIKPNRRRGEGYHWDVLAEHARSSGYRMPFASLQDIAFSYALQDGDSVDRTIIAEPRIGREDDVIRYPELACVNLEARLDAFLGDLCRELKQRERSSLFRRIKFLRKNLHE